MLRDCDPLRIESPMATDVFCRLSDGGSFGWERAGVKVAETEPPGPPARVLHDPASGSRPVAHSRANG